MRLATPALLVVVILFLFSAGAASAVTAGCIHGKPCFGTGKDDRITGSDGGDEIMARGGRDFVNGRGGSDLLRGGPGDDGDVFAPGGLFGDSPGMSANSVRD